MSSFEEQVEGKVATRRVSRVKIGELSEESEDVVAIEEPLEIRVAGDTIATTMRTPGDDVRLALGFLHAEGILTSIDEVGRVFHCGRPGSDDYGNTIEVLPAPGTVLNIERISASRRGTLTTSACGVCGRQSVDDLLEICGALEPGPQVSPNTITDVVERLRDAQPTFASTGGVHAAGIFSPSGKLLVCYEDVGRHNAVDKAIGSLLFDRILGADRAGNELGILAVSGRSSFEIVQKAAVARIPILASVSAPSSLAVDLASTLGMTLVGFVRGEKFNIYSGLERITGIGK